jgi:hypothetical protein
MDRSLKLRRLSCVQLVAIGFSEIPISAESEEKAILAKQLEVVMKARESCQTSHIDILFKLERPSCLQYIALCANEDLDSQAKRFKRWHF